MKSSHEKQAKKI